MICAAAGTSTVVSVSGPFAPQDRPRPLRGRCSRRVEAHPSGRRLPPSGRVERGHFGYHGRGGSTAFDVNYLGELPAFAPRIDANALPFSRSDRPPADRRTILQSCPTDQRREGPANTLAASFHNKFFYPSRRGSADAAIRSAGAAAVIVKPENKARPNEASS